MTSQSSKGSSSTPSDSASTSASASPSSLPLLIWMSDRWENAYNELGGDIYDAPPQDLLIVPILCVIFYLLRKLVRKLAVPLAVKLGIPPRKLPSNKRTKKCPALENLFLSRDRSEHVICRVASENNLTPNQIQFWLRRRQKNSDLLTKPQLIDKFQDTACRFMQESFLVVFGACAMWNKPWAWSLEECWRGWPTQPRDMSIRWYYIFQIACCSLSLLTHFGEARRKDFWQMFAHHVVTLILVIGSWSTNNVRIGSLILLLHDVVDPVLQFTKMAAYTKCEPLSTWLFALFAFLWLSTRLIIFPLRIISTCIGERVEIYKEEGVLDERMEALFSVFTVCLWFLYVLHWIWFYHIIVLIVKVTKGEKIKDTRSEDEDEEEEGKVRVEKDKRPEATGSEERTQSNLVDKKNS